MKERLEYVNNEQGERKRVIDVKMSWKENGRIYMIVFGKEGYGNRTMVLDQEDEYIVLDTYEYTKSGAKTYVDGRLAHRRIMRAEEDEIVIHRDGNKYNNTRENLIKYKKKGKKPAEVKELMKGWRRERLESSE